MTDKFSKQLTFLMNLRSQKFPKARFLAHEDVDMFKTIDVHKYNAPFGIMKDKEDFKLVRHSFPKKKAKSLKMYPVLYNRFQKRPNNLQ